MAALTTYERYLGCDMPDRVDCGKFLKQCPIPVYRLQMDKETEEAPYLDIGVSRLYDTHKDPGQQNPLTDKELEEKMCLALAEQMELHDAPGEQYERLGLESFQMKNHI